jgi:hypothetical protein
MLKRRRQGDIKNNVCQTQEYGYFPSGHNVIHLFEKAH